MSKRIEVGSTLEAYMEGYYTSEDDHKRAMYGAYIIGYLEALFDQTAEEEKKDGFDQQTGSD